MHDIIILALAIIIGAASFAVLLKKFGADCIP
jgi:large-conductance mechanosensitive channel